MWTTRALIPALVLIFGLGIGNEARAGGKVDWSDYLEPPGARPPVRQQQAAPVQVASKATPTRAKPAKAKAAKKTAAKAKKKSARSGRRR